MGIGAIRDKSLGLGPVPFKWFGSCLVLARVHAIPASFCARKTMEGPFYGPADPVQVTVPPVPPVPVSSPVREGRAAILAS